MWWVEHGWVVSTVAKCVDTSWTGKTEQQETGRTYYPMKLLERDSSEEKTKKEQSQWQTETSERPPSPSSHQLLRGGKGQKSHPCWITPQTPAQLSALPLGRHNLNSVFFSKRIPKFWASQPPFLCSKFFQFFFALPPKYILHLGLSFHGFFVCSHFPKGSNVSGCLWHVYLQKKKGISLWNALLNRNISLLLLSSSSYCSQHHSRGVVWNLSFIFSNHRAASKELQAERKPVAALRAGFYQSCTSDWYHLQCLN